MAPNKRSTNGRSPLVNQQRQITAFFCKKQSSQPKRNTNSAEPALSPSQNPGPNTPSPFNPKRTKPKAPLIVGSSPNCGEEVVNRRIKVYWPLDKSWYEGSVESFDKLSGKHLVRYDDGEEESLDISKEKIEWIDDADSIVVKKNSFRRLRKMAMFEEDNMESVGNDNGDAELVVVKKKRLIRLRKRSVNEEEEEDLGNVDSVGNDCDNDSEDEDWGKNLDKENVEDEDFVEDMDLEDEDEELGENRKRSASKGAELRKRKFRGDKLSSSRKKTMIVGDVKTSVCSVSSSVNGGNPIEPAKKSVDCPKASLADSPITGDASERFASREAAKLWFLGADRRDANRRLPGDENYDARTLYLPPDFLKSLTGGQRQWWQFKSKHMDKVLFFKMGKFYELFEMDAHIGAKELDLQYMKGDQPHCGFPEKNFSLNLEKLARKGYRVLVVEQTETPEQLELRRREKGSKDKVVKREICSVVTKGTLMEGEMLATNPEASYMMAVTENCQVLENQGGHTFGICVVDVATSKIIVGQFRDDSDCSSLCCLLSELRPVEIIKPAKMLTPETEQVLLRHTRNPLVNELVPFSEFWDAEKTIREVKDIYQRIADSASTDAVEKSNDLLVENNSEKIVLPDVLLELVSDGDNGRSALSALGGALFYLKQVFLDESLLRFAKFELLPCSGFGEITQKPYMVLDAAALENLEIFENSRNGDSSGSLYAQLNHCVTGFGKRLLRTWLARPLYCHQAIRERQDAILGLTGVNLPFVLEFRKELSRLPDMERLLARIFTASEANGRNANKVVLYEDAAKKQLQEFISALRGCELMMRACSSLSIILENVDSVLLHHLLKPGKGVPEIHPILRHFKDAFDWEEANNSGRVVPREGADIEYDAACQTVKDIESNLRTHLKGQQNLLGDTSISYVTIGKDAYLLEVPENLSQSIPKEYELRSSKKGFFRYWTPVIKKFIGELTQAESEKEAKLKSILQRLIRRFCEHHSKWRQLVSSIAEVDVLISLSIASQYYEGSACRPTISPSCQDEVPSLAAKSLGHPVLRSDTLGKGSFVSNDVSIGGSNHVSFILLTGPNMGGKSTLLRQVCLAVILAQIGADVPAENFQLSLVDRIFVRMGAKDQIMTGQSTFLTELLETASMLSSATRNSLVALDELGRGTSTSDGQAIAGSVLEHFVRKVQCRGIFSTHYQRLAIDYQEDPKVSLCHMACQVGKGVAGLEEVIFLYRLTPGACPKSYGVNVARLAGLPDTVLRKAAAKSQEFEGTYGRRSEDTLHNNGWDGKASITMQKLLNMIANRDYHSLESMANSLGQLQCRARELVEQL